MNEFSSLSQRSVPVRYAHLHCPLGEGGRKQNNNQQRFRSTKFILGLDQKLTPLSFCILHSALNWWPARVTRPVLRIKSPVHHFNACRPEDGARGRTRTCTGDALNVVSLLVDYASCWRRAKIGSSSRGCSGRIALQKRSAPMHRGMEAKMVAVSGAAPDTAGL